MDDAEAEAVVLALGAPLTWKYQHEVGVLLWWAQDEVCSYAVYRWLPRHRKLPRTHCWRRRFRAAILRWKRKRTPREAYCWDVQIDKHDRVIQGPTLYFSAGILEEGKRGCMQFSLMGTCSLKAQETQL